jgi:acyl-CoA thioester hydrolase
VTVEVKESGRASLVIAQRALRSNYAHDEQLLAEGTIRIGCVDTGTFRPRRIPNDVLAALAPEQQDSAE